MLLNLSRVGARPRWRLLILALLLLAPTPVVAARPALERPLDGDETCAGAFIAVSPALSDLGAAEYVRLGGGPTGHIGGLYPGGANERPPRHDAAGLAQAALIRPLDAAGDPDPDGRIVLVSVGMSNTAQEFRAFRDAANLDPDKNPALVIVNGALAGATSDQWVDPDAMPWQQLDIFLAQNGVTPEQVQVAWVKQTQTGPGDFPAKALALQSDLEAIARNLLLRFANIKLAHYSSRTRAYLYWNGLSPEPTAFETAFAVRWLVQKQINGDPSLNFDAAAGPVVAPYLAWGPYLWIDGLNPRSDGRTWPADNLMPDCVHPSPLGVQQVSEQLLAFFKSDSTAVPWFLAEPPQPPVHDYFLPILLGF